MKKCVQVGDLNEDTVQNDHQIQMAQECKSSTNLVILCFFLSLTSSTYSLQVRVIIVPEHTQ